MIYDPIFKNENKQTIHHRNSNRFDNSPNNLVLMNKKDHLKYHSEQARYNFKPNKSEDFTLEWKNNISKAALGKVRHFKTWKIKNPEGKCFIIENLNDFCRKENLNRSNIKGNYGSKGYHAEILRNHKVISVEYLKEKIDVGCITVDLNETYHSHHTYLLDAGVYTKNTMMEDYWLPRREGGRGTEVTTLPGGQTLGQMDDVLYFQKKFLQCLNVPVSRLNSDALFSIGRATEITRDELKFGRYVVRLRSRFAVLFTKMLEKQLVLKNVFTLEDFNAMCADIKYDWSKDNYFTELKDAEMIEARSNLARSMQDMVGKYYSHAWVRKNILKQSDEDIVEMDKQINEENSLNDPRWINPTIEAAVHMLDQNQMETQQAQADVNATHAQTDQGVEDNLISKREEIRQAQQFIDQMKKKKGGRTPAEQSKYKAAVQVIAKNKDILSQLGMSVKKSSPENNKDKLEKALIPQPKEQPKKG